MSMEWEGMRMRPGTLSNSNRFLAWMLLPAIGAACGSVKATTDAGGGNDAAAEVAPPTNDEACGQFAQLFCARLGDCAPFAVALLYGDATTCVTRSKLGCTMDQEITDITRTATDIVACAAAASGASCDDLLAGILPAACQPKPGTRINGQGCGSNLQCMSTLCEKPRTDCGTCAPRAAVNGDCTGDDGCTMGLVCANKKCQTPGTSGATCDANHPCRGNLYCSNNGNVCATRSGVAGTACAGDTSICDLPHGFGCNVLSMNPSCVAVSVATGGNACGFMNGALTLCELNNSCAGATIARPSGTCPNPAGDGQTCGDASHCLSPASCVNGLCRFPSVGSCTK